MAVARSGRPAVVAAVSEGTTEGWRTTSLGSGNVRAGLVMRYVSVGGMMPEGACSADLKRSSGTARGFGSRQSPGVWSSAFEGARDWRDFMDPMDNVGDDGELSESRRRPGVLEDPEAREGVKLRNAEAGDGATRGPICRGEMTPVGLGSRVGLAFGRFIMGRSRRPSRRSASRGLLQLRVGGSSGSVAGGTLGVRMGFPRRLI